MGLATTHAVALLGIDGAVIEIEAHVGLGLPAFTLVGLPDTALSEARDRVRAALLNSGQAFPDRRLTVGLSPAMLPKAGAHFDLAIAVAVIAANGQLPVEALQGVVLLGELGLDGQVRPVRGILPLALAAAAAGWVRLVVPEPNAAEAALVAEVSVIGVRSLRQLVAHLRGEAGDDPPMTPVGGEPAPRSTAAGRGDRLDLSDVLGQAEARLAMEVAAAGGHHVFLSGPPGAGKTMLAERLPGLLPDLDLPDALEVSAIHSVAGLLPEGEPLLAATAVRRPAPHRERRGDRRRWEPVRPTRGGVPCASGEFSSWTRHRSSIRRRSKPCGSRSRAGR